MWVQNNSNTTMLIIYSRIYFSFIQIHYYLDTLIIINRCKSVLLYTTFKDAKKLPNWKFSSRSLTFEVTCCPYPIFILSSVGSKEKGKELPIL